MRRLFAHLEGPDCDIAVLLFAFRNCANIREAAIWTPWLHTNTRRPRAKSSRALVSTNLVHSSGRITTDETDGTIRIRKWGVSTTKQQDRCAESRDD